MTAEDSSTDDYRTAAELNGSWQFVTDPDADGHEHDWYDPDAVWPDRARDVQIPHSWQEYDEYREYTGTAWYRRRVDIDADALEGRNRALLRFGAVDYETTVWVNGEQVGSNRGGYLPFAIDVTDALEAGKNAVVVEVVDPEDSSEIPHGKQGAPWYQRISGIWQAVTLEFVPETRVTDVRVTPNLETDTACVDVDVGSETAVDDVTATVTVARDGDTVARADAAVDTDGDADGTGKAKATISIDDPDYWSPDDPALYDVTVTLDRSGTVLDCYEDYFGMRSIERRDGQLYLNGEPYYMRGALDQGYYPKTLYRPFDEDLFEEEIRTAKELGFNLLRKHIKPAHPDFLELADRLGILVWEEPANPTVHTDRSKREVREQIRGLIERDYNRPSVIVWSLYNEEWGIGNPQGLDEETSLWEDETKQEYLADLYAEAKDWDPTRIVCDNSGWAHVATDVNDYHRYFVSPDRAQAWADDVDAMTSAPEDNYGATVTDPEDAPLIVSEFGTWGMCDLPAIEDYYGGTPPWFDYDFFDDPIKRPEGVYDRFEETTLPDVFDDWDELAAAWQRREFRSIKDVIERMRVADGVNGYVITEFSDIEWEFNGILDYRRERKVFHDEFAAINDDVLVTADVETHALEAGETLTADVIIVNDTTASIDAAVEWNAFGQSGSVPVERDGFGVTRVEDAISVTVPDVDDVTSDELTVSLPDGPTNREPITAVPTVDAGEGDDPITVYADVDALAARLEAVGFEIAESFGRDSDADVALITDPDDRVEEFAERGGTVVRLPDESGHMVDGDYFEYRQLPEDESWNLVASLFYTEAGPLRRYTDTVPGWELEGLYPYDVVSSVDAEHDVHVGYVEGWIANWSSAVSVRPYGEGQIGAFTFRVTDQFEQPVALAALTDFIVELAQKRPVQAAE